MFVKVRTADITARALGYRSLAAFGFLSVLIMLVLAFSSLVWELAVDNVQSISRGVGMAFGVGGGGSFPLVAPLFTIERLMRREVTDQPTRRKLNEAIAENPGLTKSQLSRLTSIPWSSLSYHMSVLEQNQLITTVDKKYYFSQELARQPGVLLLTPLQRRILEEVKTHGYTNQRDLAEKLDLSKTTLQRNLQKMKDIDLGNGV